MRVATGIHGLDDLIAGGIPKNHMVLLSGTCGSGKTIFGLQFLHSTDENGIFLSFEEDVEQLKRTSESFGWKHNVNLLKYDPYKLEDILDILENNIRETNAVRVVIDPMSALGVYTRDIAELRRTMLQISSLLKKSGCTSIIVSEITNPESLSRFGIEEFVCDGVIRLLAGSDEKYKGQLSIIKMRTSDHSQGPHNYRITNKGIAVL